MRRTEVFRFRLTPQENAKLERRRVKEGLESKSDVIRRALGWDLEAPPARDLGATAQKVAAQPTPADVDPDENPGLAAMQQIAGRIRDKEQG